MRSPFTTALLASLGPLLLGLAAPAAAQWHDAPQQPYGWNDDRGWDDRRGNDRNWDNRRPDNRGQINRGWRNQGWNDRAAGGYYDQGGYDQRVSHQGWQGGQQADWCRRSDGTAGTLIGAGIGGVIGNQVARRGDKTLGTVAGAIVGGLLGRSIDNGRTACR